MNPRPAMNPRIAQVIKEELSRLRLLLKTQRERVLSTRVEIRELEKGLNGPVRTRRPMTPEERIVNNARLAKGRATRLANLAAKRLTRATVQP